MIFSIIIFLVTLTLLVIIHELGHFLMAKKFNIKVLEFGFGIPPRMIGKKVGETILSINWLPIGGFVHLLGEDDIDKQVLENKRSFAAQAVWKRIVVVVAGVVMNLFVAWILYTGILAVQGFKYQMPLLFPHKFVGVYQSNESLIGIGNVVPGSPAGNAGLKQGDRVLAIDGKDIDSIEEMINLTKQKAGQEIKLTLSDLDKNNQRTVTITPRKDPPAGEGSLGISLNSFNYAQLEYRDWWQKVFVGPIHSYNVASSSFDTLGKLISQSIAKKDFKPVSVGVGGPVAIGYFSNIVLNQPDPLLKYLDLVAGISFSLALFNVLPIPALDGGRLFFLVIEAVTRRKVNPHFEKNIHAIGMVILLGLFVLISYKDVTTYIVPEVTKLLGK